MAVHFEASRSERGSDRERLGIDGMMIYSILHDARTLSTVEILLFLSYSVALFKTSVSQALRTVLLIIKGV